MVAQKVWGPPTAGHGAREDEGGCTAAYDVSCVVASVNVDPVFREVAQAAQHCSLSRDFVLLNLKIRAVAPWSGASDSPAVPPCVPEEAASQESRSGRRAPPLDAQTSPTRLPAHLWRFLWMDVTFHGGLGRPGRPYQSQLERAPSSPRPSPTSKPAHSPGPICTDPLPRGSLPQDRPGQTPTSRARSVETHPSLDPPTEPVPITCPAALGDGDGVVQKIFKLFLEGGLLRLQRGQDLPRRGVLAGTAA